MGGSAFVAGLVLLAFAVPSFTIRPFVGHVADKWSAAGVLAVGLADLVGLRGMYGGSVVITAAGFALLATTWKSLPRPHRAA